MSLIDSYFDNSKDVWDAPSVQVDIAPDDVFQADSAVDSVDFEGMQEGLIDTFFDRNRGSAPSFSDTRNGADKNQNQDVTPAQQKNLNLQAAQNNARSFQSQTTKLEAGKITSASGQGARQAGNYIEAKASATQDLKANIAAVRKENEGQQPAGPQASAGGGVAGAAKNLTVSSLAGVAADLVIPGAGMAMTVAAMGAGTFGAKSSKSEFSSPSEKGGESVYQTASGHESFDIMQPSVKAPVMSGQDFDRKMSSGPGFGGLGEIEHIIEPSLEDARPTFDNEQLAALEATASQMQRDVEIGAQMYKKWVESDVTVSDSIGSTPVTELKVDDQDMTSLTRDNPALGDEAMKPPTVSAMKLV